MTLISFEKPLLERDREGFALIVAILLVSFFLVLVLTITSLVRTETQSSSYQNHEIAAQRNAMLALREALGELQVAAGPDQRITATGGLWDIPATGTENLVGVWSTEDLDNNGEPDGTFQRWLVSRVNYEDAEMENLPTLAQPIAFAGQNYNSTDPVNYAVLVGSGSVMSDPSRPNSFPGVVGELKSLPASKQNAGGKYAWWVGDEGSKARFDMLDPFAFQEVPGYEASAWQNANLRTGLASQSMHGSSLSALTGFSGLDLVNVSARSAQLAKSTSMGQLSLVEFDPDSTLRSEEVRRHFHDITADSMGIQTNARAGGLKRDLSLLFELPDAVFDSSSSAFMQALSDENLVYTNAPGAKSTLPLIFKEPIRGAVNGDIYGPTWDMLRDYYRLYKGVAGSATSDPLLPSEWGHTYAPGKAWFTDQGGAANDQEGWLRSLALMNWRNIGGVDPYETSTRYQRVAPTAFKELQGVTEFGTVRATKGAYLPVLSRFTILYSTVAIPDGSGGYDMDVVVQPFIAMHNPYNVSVEAPNMRVMQELEKFEIAVRRDDGGVTWDGSIPFKTGEVSASDPKFLGNVYKWSASTNTESRKLSVSNIFEVTSGDNEPRFSSKYGRELTYSLGAHTYAPGEVKLFAASGSTSFSSREVTLDEFGGSYDPNNGVYLGLPGYSFWVHPDGNSATAREKLLQEIAGDEDIMLQITHGSYMRIAYEVYNAAHGNFDTAGSFIHATDKMSGDNVVQRTLPQLQGEAEADYIESLDAADNFSAGPVPHLVIDSFLKPLDYVERIGQADTMSQQERTFPNFIISNPLAASFSHTATVEKDGNGFGAMIHTAGFRVPVSTGPTLSQDLYDGDKGSWGSNTGRFGQKNAVVLEIPRAPLHSLGQLQHASVNPSPYYPALSIGQSFRSPFLSASDEIYHSFTDGKYSSGQPFVFYDQNFLLNEALWDGYFFSSIAPQPDDASYSAVSPSSSFDPFTNDLPDVVDQLIVGESAVSNPRVDFMDTGVDLATAQAELLNPLTSAKHLGVKGAFNVNSTSVRAWQAFLGGYRDMAIQYYDAANTAFSTDTSLPGPAFLRHSMPGGASGTSSTSINDATSWTGFMRLTDAELLALAESIVSQIKARGVSRGTSQAPVPAMGLADFVNRMPFNSGFEEAGTLQAAIDASAINDTRFSSNTAFDTAVYNGNRSKFDDASFELNAASVAPISLNQGDILQAIGGAISARSDTFRIRAYGETTDSSGNFAQSWCEAIVQRSTELTDAGTYDRRFKIVSLRWLNPDEV
ncbi:MAG: hypothetical protein ACPGN3_14025 [Opitutales bacterium]